MQSILFNQFFTIQDNSNYHAVDKLGSVHRSNFPILKANIPCNIQELNRLDAIILYNIKVSEKLYIIYHRYNGLIIDETKRFLININPFKTLTLPGTTEIDILILEYKGRRNPILLKNAYQNTFELFCEYNKRWKL